MKKGKAYQNLFILIALLLSVTPAQAQTSWFADGYHGGVYGHYPIWQTHFMVEKLTENPKWKINY